MYQDGEWGYFAKSSDLYFKELEKRLEKVSMNDLVKSVDIWNEKIISWKQIFNKDMNTTQIANLFK